MCLQDSKQNNRAKKDKKCVYLVGMKHYVVDNYTPLLRVVVMEVEWSKY